MAVIDLRDYSVIKAAKLVSANEIILEDLEDELTLTGPVHVCVRLQAINKTTGPNEQVSTHYHDVYQYNWMVPAGHAGRLRASEALQQLRLGSNHGSRIVVCRTGPDKASPSVRIAGDLPCDFAIGDIPDTGQFFPSGCEPCPPGKSISLPPGTTPSLITPPAEGGCVRTRFFNGMFITQEDLETEQRFFRMKNKLQNQTVGQGVVWGLDVSCQGDFVCVHPGYALDCRGNTLVVTTPYKVDVESLLRDPIAFQYLIQKPTATSADCNGRDGVAAIDRVSGIRGRLADISRKMHLLLEYVECPEKPRPVHGDPCSPDVTHCEMSRTRETVRLRLVPPREPDTGGPIERFLEEVEKLKKQGRIADFEAEVAGAQAAQPGTFVPFNLKLTFTAPPAAVTLPPDVSKEQSHTQQLVLSSPGSGAFRIQATPNANYSLTEGTLERPDGSTVPVDPTSQTPLEWSVGVQASEQTTSQTFTIRNWTAAPLFQTTDQSALSGTTRVQVDTTTIRVTDNQSLVFVRVLVPPTDVVAAQPRLAPWPCTGAPCGEDPLGGLFHLLPPFLHRDPLRPAQAADWRVLIAAATYAWLSSEMARHKTGTPNAVVTNRLRVAVAIYLAALRLLYGKGTPQEALRLTQDLRCLFQAWCGSFLYPGPRCDENPMGVVIGCARIQGGAIRELDPLGGRRWVVTYPLLSHWGRLFGIAPLDVTMSRIFNLICCIGELPLPEAPDDRLTRGKLTYTGNVYLVEASKEDALRELAKADVELVRERTATMDEFVANLTTGLRTREAPPGAKFELLSLRDAPDIHIAVPIDIPPEVKPDPAVAVVRKFVPPDTAERRKVPVLVRSKTDELSANILDQTPIADLENSGAAEEFRAAGILTYGALLSRDPDEIVEKVLRGEKTKEFSGIYERSEKQTESITKAINDIVAKVSAEKQITSPADLQTDESVEIVTEALAAKLSSGRRPVIAKPVLEAIVHNTLKAGKKRRG